MLAWLRVSDLAIIDSLELELGPGLNVVTGETGAGKSILVSALELLLGAPGREELVRGGAKRAEVEALFEMAPEAAVAPDLADRLQRIGVEVDDELVIRRVVSESGRSRAFVNGQLVTRPQLTQLTRGLLDISSQHEHHTLSNPSTHLSFLDAFGGLDAQRQRMRQAYFALRDASNKLEAFESSVRDREAREATLRTQIDEIEALAPQPGEDAELDSMCRRLRHAETLQSLCNEANELLYEGDASVVEALARANRQLSQAALLDPELTALTEQLDSVQVQLEDSARSLGHHIAGLCSDPAALEQAEDRLHELSKLQRRYGGSIDAVLQQLEQARRELDDLDDHTQTLAALARTRTAAHDEARRHTTALTRKRKSAASRLGRAISAELDSLGLGEARVVVDVSSLRTYPRGAHTSRDNEPRHQGLVIDGVHFGPNGADRAELLIAPNRGEIARPLHRIASGGELSRAMLAIKCVLADLGPSGMYAFDEVDAGVGGAMAEVIGRKIRDVANHRQVLCITHLPQIAVFASQHFLVEKAVVGQRTVSTVRKLSASERREEIARMLGGLRVTAKTRAAAKEMLQQAEFAA
jgi:DNA repair protein RecN (Recombination protein N)